jgi:hypothetical protein
MEGKSRLGSWVTALRRRSERTVGERIRLVNVFVTDKKKSYFYVSIAVQRMYANLKEYIQYHADRKKGPVSINRG